MDKKPKKLLDQVSDARGLAESNFVEGVVKSTMSQLTQWTVDADKVLVF